MGGKGSGKKITIINAGVLRCEYENGACLKPAKDYIRNKREIKGWSKLNWEHIKTEYMPIALCDEHKGKHVPL